VAAWAWPRRLREPIMRARGRRKELHNERVKRWRGRPNWRQEASSWPQTKRERGAGPTPKAKCTLARFQSRARPASLGWAWPARSSSSSTTTSNAPPQRRPLIDGRCGPDVGRPDRAGESVCLAALVRSSVLFCEKRAAGRKAPIGAPSF